ncbi:YqiA/YcfP family alpha/beta fold hydrolase [Candidatus Uabimicrobium sp. HlEnr_7]|uniref:YqiA/YcfP family alpha/beta fold hydrolase n=1 Tax=Candidatus Uabimicrobium helgolandensis TaxID=3095367 RepID=UPI003557029E
MSKSIVYFSHGKESGPWGTKISRLAEISKEYSFSVESPDYSFTKNGDERVVHFMENIYDNKYQKVVLVGSSMGGYLATVVSQRIEALGLFLLAPALYMPGYSCQKYKSQAAKISVVHGWNDTIIPVENSMRFAQKHHCDLHVIDGDHRLVGVLDEIEKLYRNFLDLITS